MPDLNGLELQQALASADRPLSIVFITGHGDIPTSVRAMKAGATDFLSKPFDEKDLLDAIERALQKAEAESGERAAAREAQAAARRRLTPREHEVLLHVLAGELNKQIAAALGTSEKTDQGASGTGHAQDAGPVRRRSGPALREGRHPADLRALTQTRCSAPRGTKVP